MVVLNHNGEEINAKIVYYGPGVSGKTTNLEYIHEKMPVRSKGKLVSMKTRTDRTLFFDFLPLELGEINGYRSRFLLYTVPGQVYYNATRKLVLKGVDAVVFVADSSRAKLAENIESLRNLEDNLNENGLSLDHIPWVMQYNKRDVADAMPVAQLHEHLNLLGVPAFEAVATEGVGVYDTFQGVAGLLFDELRRKLERGDVATEPASVVEPASIADPVSEAVDSALREVNGAAATAVASAPPAHAPAAPASPPKPHHGAQAAGSPAGANLPGQSSASAQESPRPAARAQPTAVTTPAPEPEFSFEAIPDDEHDSCATARIHEAAVASEAVRDQAAPEFVIDPMGQLAKESASPPDWMADTHAAPIEVAPEVVPQKGPAPGAVRETPEAPATVEDVPLRITVPVTISRSSLVGAPRVTITLDIRLSDD